MNLFTTLQEVGWLIHCTVSVPLLHWYAEVTVYVDVLQVVEVDTEPEFCLVAHQRVEVYLDHTH